MNATDAELSLCHVHRGLNLFRPISCILGALPQPNHLLTMQIVMLDNLQKLIFLFMKTHIRLDKYNALWLSVPAYHNLT
jgi:hypothetical protein